METKLYRRFDLQDQSDSTIETLEQMREWLADFWNHNPDEDMTDEEHDELIDDIMNSNEDEMYDRLEGIDYAFEELVEKDLTV